MKKVILTNLSVLFASLSLLAQIQKIERPEVVKKMPSTLPAPPPSNLPAGKDLSISIKSFLHDPANGGSITVNYAVKNNGADAVDLNNVTIQAYLDYPNATPTATPPTYLVNGKYYYAAGGHAMASFSTILGGGQEKEGTLRCFNLAREHYFNTAANYSYTLMVDKNNIVSEPNEANNVVVNTFRGYQGQYQPSVNASQYYLTNAFIKINTGFDNKEQESEVNIRLIPTTAKDLANTGNEFIARVAKNQQPFYSNSAITLPLNLFMASTYTTVNPATSLSSFTQNGLGAVIEYKANIFTDAWKIDNVELTLHFKDANGLYHPTQGVKTIQFAMPANTFLDGFAKKFLVFKADNSFNPLQIKTIEKLASY
jgi:hypothetical protein